MRVAIAALLVAAACSSGSAPTEPDGPDLTAKTITVGSSLTSTYPGPWTRGGRQFTLSAVVKNAAGETLANAPVTWTSKSPALASVTQAGLVQVADTAIGRGSLNFEAQSGSAKSSIGVSGDDWSLSRFQDPVTLTFTLEATRSAASGPTRLHLRCADGIFEVFVSGEEITASGAVEYRFSGQPAVQSTWGESTSYKALFAPRGITSRNFAAKLLTADTLIFRYNRYLGGAALSSFVLENARHVHPRISNACPS